MQRRPSLADTKGRQSSLDLPQGNENQEPVNQDNAYETFKSLENDSLVMNQQKSLDIVLDRKSNSFERTGSSFERVNSSEVQQNYANNQPRASIQIQNAQKINNQLLQRRKSSISKRQPLSQRPSLTTPAPIALPRTLDSGYSAREQLLIAGKLPRKSYSASDSSLDELLDPSLEAANGTLQYGSNQLNSPHASDDEDQQEESNLTGTTRLSRSVHQLSTRRSSTRLSAQQYKIPAIHTSNANNTNNQLTDTYQNNIESTTLGKSNSSTMLARNNTSSSSIRRPTSARIRKQSSYFTYETSDLNQQNLTPNLANQTQQQTQQQPNLQHIPSNNPSIRHATIRRQSDSQGSEGSEPIDNNSLSLSSPDYSRSPRQSADSDILGLREFFKA